MLNEFVQIFTQMSSLAIIFLVAGFALMLLEIIFPALGMFMLTGVVCIIGGIVTRSIQGATFFQIVAMVVVFGVVALLLFYCCIKSLGSGESRKTALVQNGVVTKYSDPYEEFGHLLGLVGTIVAECKPYGKAKVDGNRYEVVSDDGTFIPKNADVEIVDVDYDHIFVKTIR